MSISDSSELSSPPTTDDEALVQNSTKPSGLDRYFKPAPKGTRKGTPKVPSSPPPPKRPASPPHEYVLADNADIAFIVMFRSRFHNVFPKSLPHYGPQDIERGVAEMVPGDYIEKLLCALLGLVLNRKKEIERGHFQRALEEAIQTHQSQWPAAWKAKNPTHGGGTFTSMTPAERLTLLKTLILWALSSSEAVQSLIKESYKQTRHEDDKNQPLSIQPWGRDGYKRRYWLIEGQDDTNFRLYRENNGVTPKTNQWFSVAGSIEEVNIVANKLDEDGTPHARTLRDRIRAAIPRFETGEEKRRRRDYRLARKAAFTRPLPGFSLYEGRTRGKKMRYTFSDDEEDSDDFPSRRSTRNSGVSTPAEPAGPTVTASGRQVKSRLGGSMYGETMLVDQRKVLEIERSAAGDAHGFNDGELGELTDRPQRSTRPSRKTRAPRRIDDSSEEEMKVKSDGEEASDNEWSGNEEEPDAEEFEAEGVDEDEDDDDDDDDDDEMSARDLEMNDAPPPEQDSLVVQLRYKKGFEQSKQQQHPGLKNAEGAAADCIAVDSRQPMLDKWKGFG
ncbi:hypothetical protein GJ744_009678 [Endocarpon pusillum]|uniref:WHIM1 domain-containing protein n=1 Tax=Endocarpon pusillum TaxID=364733 RepID=A0A8H7AS26_9EURO|nr:hypothetical protein GJ744_009678 [Endocarpon pusillum]